MSTVTTHPRTKTEFRKDSPADAQQAERKPLSDPEILSLARGGFIRMFDPAEVWPKAWLDEIERQKPHADLAAMI